MAQSLLLDLHNPVKNQLNVVAHVQHLEPLDHVFLAILLQLLDRGFFLELLELLSLEDLAFPKHILRDRHHLVLFNGHALSLFRFAGVPSTFDRRPILTRAVYRGRYGFQLFIERHLDLFSINLV